MKKVLTIILSATLIVSAAGCTSRLLPMRREISDLRLVQVVGIDKPEALSGYHSITIASKKMTDQGSGSGQSAGGNKSLVDTAEGRTLFEAARNIQTHSDKTIFWGHVDYYLIGEDAARDNISKYIDFFARDNEYHIDAKVYIVKGMTAKSLIEQFNKSDFYIVDKLDNMKELVKLLSLSESMKLSELMRYIDMHSGSARVPCIELVQREGSSGQAVVDIETSGYAILKDLKLVSFIDGKISRGVNLITNKVGTSIVVVKDLKGKDASLEITSGKTEVIPRFAGTELEEVTLKVKIKCNLGEVQSQQRTFYDKNFKHMEAQLNETLENEMQLVLDQVLKTESDCLDICDAIRLKTPIQWHRIESQWMQVMTRVRYRVKVESVIERSYELNEPNGYGGWTET